MITVRVQLCGYAPKQRHLVHGVAIVGRIVDKIMLTEEFLQLLFLVCQETGCFHRQPIPCVGIC